MHRFLSVVAVAILASSLSVRAQDQPAGEVLTLDQAIALGLQQNRSIRSDRADVKKAEDAVASIKTRRLPAFEVNFLEARLLAEVNLDFPAGAFGMFPSTGPVPPTETNVTTPAQWTSTVFFRVNQPLTQLYRIGLGTRQLELSRDIGSERVRSRELSVTGDIRRLYYGILQTQYALTASDQSLALHVEVDRLVREFIKQGVALEAEGLEVGALVAKEQAGVRALHDSSASLHEELNALLGRDITTAFTVAPVPDTQLGDEALPVLEARAMTQRPEVKQAALALSQAKYDVRIKHSTLYPDVSATVDFLGFYRWQVLPPAVAMAGFFATWEPLDWGRKRHEVDASQRAVEQATVATGDADAMVRIDVRTSYRRLATAREAAHVADLAVAAARERLRVATTRYREQSSLFRDVLEAQAALSTADEHLYDATLQLATTRADLEKAVGDR